jgi:hypothetical protein
MADGTQTKALGGLLQGLGGGAGGGVPSFTSTATSSAASGGGVFTVENGGGGLGLGAVRHWPWYAWAAIGLAAVVWAKNKGR